MLRLVEIRPSPRGEKKWVARFSDKTETHFGQAGSADYTIGASTKQRTAYRSRHAGDRLSDPKSPGALSYYILWGDSTDMDTNVKSYRKRFQV